MTAPELGTQHRKMGYERSLETRRAQAEVKRQLGNGELTFRQALEHPNAGGIKVEQLLRAARGVGLVRAKSIMIAAGIPLEKRVRGLGKVQYAHLVLLMEETDVAHAARLPDDPSGDHGGSDVPEPPTESAD